MRLNISRLGASFRITFLSQKWIKKMVKGTNDQYKIEKEIKCVIRKIKEIKFQKVLSNITL